LTKNEALSLPDCLTSLAWCRDIHVVDSGSSDATVEVAETAGAKIWHHPFASFGAQRNWALDHCEPIGEWILFLDADERSTPNFEAAVKHALASAEDGVAGFYCCWKLMLEGRWLRRSDSFPRWQFRLLRKGRARFEDAGHGQRESQVDGRLEYLREPYVHEAFIKGWADWIAKHNRYSDQEAASRTTHGPKVAWRAWRRGTRAEKMAGLKALASRMPGWPLIRFLHAYVLKLGLLEGTAGLIYASNMAFYEYLIWIKMRELRKAKRLAAEEPQRVETAAAPLVSHK